MTALYHFRCPCCGATDELVGPAREHQVHCGVCSTIAGVPVVLERWRVAARPGLAGSKADAALDDDPLGPR